MVSSLTLPLYQASFAQPPQPIQRRPTRQARLKTHFISLRLQFRLLSEWFEPFLFDGSVYGVIMARW